MSLSGAMLLGTVSVLMMELGGRKMLAGAMTPGQWFAYSAFLAFLIAPVFQIVAIGTQITEAITGLERTREILDEKPEDEAPGRTTTMDRVNGLVEADHVSFSYESRSEEHTSELQSLRHLVCRLLLEKKKKKTKTHKNM